MLIKIEDNSFVHTKSKYRANWPIGYWQKKSNLGHHQSDEVRFDSGYFSFFNSSDSTFLNLSGEYLLDSQGNWIRYQVGVKNDRSPNVNTLYSQNLPVGYIMHLGERAERGIATIRELLDSDFNASHPAFAGLLASERYQFHFRPRPLQPMGKRIGLLSMLRQHER